MSYGGTAFTLKDDFGVTEEEAQKFIDGYFGGFPDLKIYFDKTVSKSFRDGYITIDNITGRRYYFKRIEELRAWNRTFKFLDKETKKLFYKIKGSYTRYCYNYPIQGGSGSMTKLACIYLYKWIEENNYEDKVKIVNIVHDEIDAEAADEVLEEANNKVKECMERAGAVFCKKIPIIAELTINNCWKK